MIIFTDHLLHISFIQFEKLKPKFEINTEISKLFTQIL